MASVQKLSAAFPQMKAEFFDLLAERIVKSGMTGKRLEYAVNHVLDHFTYKTLTIADVLSVDVKCRIYTYAEMLSEVSRIGGTTSDYAPVAVEGTDKPSWVRKVDKARYNIPDKL